jgi:ABC-type polysaccharide/polyol phosphate transport system ATPase subunit
MNDICIRVDKLSKRFFVFTKRQTAFQTLIDLVCHRPFKREFWALSDISFEIKKGEKIAIIGKNGSGKTTLLRILTKIYRQTSGHVEVNETPRAVFRFWSGFTADLSLIDNIYFCGAIFGIEKKYLEKNIQSILELAELYELRFNPLKMLSSGQAHRLALSVFFNCEDKLLICDEILAFVDVGFAKKCHLFFENLHSSNKTLLMTSHDNAFLKRYCDKAIWLEGGELRMFGEINDVIDKYEKSFNRLE